MLDTQVHRFGERRFVRKPLEDLRFLNLRELSGRRLDRDQNNRAACNSPNEIGAQNPSDSNISTG